MAWLLPPDKGTHFMVGVAVTLVLLMLFGPMWAGLGCLAAGIGREIYGWWKRGWRPFDRADWVEAAKDLAFTLAGGAAVLTSFSLGVNYYTKD
jgi:hypothetical protein